MEFKLLRRIGLFMGLGHLLSLLFVELVLSAERLSGFWFYQGVWAVVWSSLIFISFLHIDNINAITVGYRFAKAYLELVRNADKDDVASLSFKEVKTRFIRGPVKLYGVMAMDRNAWQLRRMFEDMFEDMRSEESRDEN